jgi:hypothetical protein
MRATCKLNRAAGAGGPPEGVDPFTLPEGCELPERSRIIMARWHPGQPSAEAGAE